METQSVGPLNDFAKTVISYLPTLAGGLVVLALGVVVGWVVKRMVVRILIWLRLDRLGGRAGWRAAFGKGDVRAALYNLLGTVAMIMVILIFLDNALQILGLSVVSRVIENLVVYLPTLGMVILILLVGILLSNLVAERTEDALEDEEFAHAGILAKILRGLLLALVTTIALWELGLARQVVLSAFLVVFGALGLGTALALGLGSAPAIQRGWEALFKKRKDG